LIFFFFCLQDAEHERPLKRHGSSSVSTSPETSASDSPTSFYPAASGSSSASSSASSSSSSSSDDDKPLYNNKTYVISTGGKYKPGDCSNLVATTSSSHHHDSQSVYSSNSNKDKVKPKTVDAATSPVDSTTTEEPEYDAAAMVDKLFDNLAKEPNKLLLKKGEKTPHSNKKKRCQYNLEERQICYITPIAEQRLNPLPVLSFADRNVLWKNMVNADEKEQLGRDPDMFEQHPSLQPRMRAILLDWLIEVCEVYKLHRETYYLTLNYLDRYMTAKKNVSKNQLQLIGITCLFIAAKVSSPRARIVPLQ